MSDPGYAHDPPTHDEEPVDDVVVRVLIWVLIGAILLILVVALATVAQSLLALVAGATTLLALVAVVGAGYLAARVVRLEERVRALELDRRS